MNPYNTETLSLLQLAVIATAIVDLLFLLHTLREIRYRRKVKQKIPTLLQENNKQYSITILFVLFILWAALEHMKN